MKSNVIKSFLRFLVKNRQSHRVIGRAIARELEFFASVYHFSKWLDTHRSAAKFPTREELWESVVKHCELERKPITYLEFGVHRGKSIRWWSDRIRDPDSRLVGFDTFTGLPEAWGPEAPEGKFDVQGHLPEVADHRVSFQVGLFQDTLDQFVRQEPGLCGSAEDRTPPSRRLVLHLDADLYSSTLYSLFTMSRSLSPGDILLFDDFRIRLIATEFRAFHDFSLAHDLSYEVLGLADHHTRAALRMTNDLAVASQGSHGSSPSPG